MKVVNKRSKKWIWLSAVFTVLLTAVIAWMPLYTAFVDWYLCAQCRDWLGGDLERKNISWVDEKWVIEAPYIANPIKLGGTLINAQAEQIELSYAFHPFSWELDILVVVTNPDITLLNSKINWDEVILDRKGSTPFIRVNPKVLIVNGKLECFDGEGKIKPLFFDIDADLTQTKRAIVKAGFDSNKEAFTAIVEKVNKRIQVNADFKELDVATVFQGVLNLVPEFDSWEVSSGTLSGHWSAVFGKGMKPAYTSSLTCRHLTLHQPKREFAAFFNEVALEFQPDPLHWNLALLDSCSLVFGSEGKAYWEITGLKGDIDVIPHEKAQVALKGLCLHDGKELAVKIEGGGSFGDENQEAMNIGFQLKGETGDALGARLFASKAAEGCDCYELEIRNFSKEDYAFVQYLMEYDFPGWCQVTMDKGMVDADLILNIENGKPKDIRLDKIKAKGLKYVVAPWNMAVEVGSLTGSLSANLEKENVFDTLDGELKIKEAVLASTQADGWKLHDLQTQLKIKEGVLQRSVIEGVFAGLEGTIDIDGTSKQKWIGLNFEGDMAGLATLGTETFSKGIKQKFGYDKVTIAADVMPRGDQVVVEGKMQVGDNEIKFGCDLFKQAKDAWTICSRLPTNGQTGIEVPWIDRELNIAEFWVQNGWFRASGLPMHKYVEPFFLSNTKMQLYGVGDFVGTFDHDHISVKYDAKDLVLESDNFVINIPRVIQTEETKSVLAVHDFDLKKMQSYGFLPAHHATYFEKNTGLLFTDIRAQIFFEDDKIRIPEIEAFCTGLYFAGDILLDLSHQKDNIYDIGIHTHTMSGKLSQLQHVFAHFDQPLAFSKLPLEGNLSYRQKGATLHFSIHPDDFDFQAHIDGSLTDGMFRIEQKNLILDEVSLNFAYDYQGNTLDFTDLQGTLLVGKSQDAEEFDIAADHIRFTDYESNKAEFDVWIGDKKRDIVRLVGTTQSASHKENLIQFNFDKKLSHLGAVHPDVLNLVLKDWMDIEAFDLHLNFDIQVLFHDLQKLSHSGLLPFSRHMQMDDWKHAIGNLSFGLHYDQGKQMFNYELNGRNVSYKDYQFREMKLKGRKGSNNWMIDQLKLDDWSFAADLTPKEQGIKVNFLGIKLEDALLIGLEGNYDVQKKLFDGEVNLFEAHLEELGSCALLKQFVDEYGPEGQLKATGKFTVESSSENGGVCIDALLEASLKSWGFQGLQFADVEGVSCHFTSDRGVTFRRLETGLKTKGNPKAQGALRLERLDYNMLSQDLSVEGLSFAVPAEALSSFMNEAKRCFPYVVSDRAVDVVSNMKENGNLEGVLDLEITSPHYALKVAMQEGRYYFLGQAHDVRDMIIEYDPCEFKLTTEYLLKNQPYWLQLTSRSPTLEEGEMHLSKEHPDSEEYKVPLVAHWKQDPKQGYYVERVFGPLAGLEFDLTCDTAREVTNTAVYLEGEIGINGSQISSLVPDYAKDAYVAWGFGQGYSLKGKVEIHFPKSEQEESSLYFHGDLLGRDFTCKGYELEQLTAKVDLSPSFITIRNLEITDPAGVLYADQVEAFLDTDLKWMVSLPQLQVNDFYPSLLREVASPVVPVKKPLVVSRIELTGLKGELGDSATMVGTGKLLFSNPPKKNLQNTIFAIPAEILSRIGLDLKVLNPVTGSIQYDIHDKKIYLTKFKDIYSEGKLSRFYLPNTDYKSYVDFEGNLHVQVKMKQYNLVFKLAELFTVTIQGSLTKPTYTLQKQQSRE